MKIQSNQQKQIKELAKSNSEMQEQLLKLTERVNRIQLTKINN